MLIKELKLNCSSNTHKYNAVSLGGLCLELDLAKARTFLKTCNLQSSK